jgi:hypothetical protein
MPAYPVGALVRAFSGGGDPLSPQPSGDPPPSCSPQPESASGDPQDTGGTELLEEPVAPLPV